ncbi:MAG: hypothetical protein AAF224_03170 [Pseudomonadota bacterium]
MTRNSLTALTISFFASTAAVAEPPALSDDILQCRAEKKKKNQIRCLEAAITRLTATRSGTDTLDNEAAANPSIARTDNQDAPEPSTQFADPVIAPTPAEPSIDRSADTAAVAVKTKEPAEGLGAEQVMACRAKTPEEKQRAEDEKVTAVITEFAITPSGTYVFFLDNGQVWRQKSADSARVRLSKKLTYDVEVRRGAISGYRLKINRLRRSLLVERLK